MSEPIAYGVDYSYTHPAPTTITSAGYTVVSRYLGTDSRCLTPAERDDLHAAGLRVSLFHQRSQPTAELSVTRARSGLAGGIEDAQLADTYADRLGAPPTTPLFGVVDVGYGFPTPADYPAIRAYFQGLLTRQRRPVGAYGPYPVLELLRDLEVDGRRVEHFHQTAGGSGSGSGTGGSAHNAGDGSTRRLSSLACAYQEYGGERIPGTDHNQIFMDARTWSWHPSDTSTSAPDRKELIMGKAVAIPANETPLYDTPTLWRVVRNQYRKRIVTLPHLANLAKMRQVDDVDAVTFTGDDAKWFVDEFPELPTETPSAGGGVSVDEAIAAVGHKLLT